MTQIKEWVEQEIESTFAAMKQVEQTVKELRIKYNGWKYVQSSEYYSISKYFLSMLGTGETYQRERITKDVTAHFAKLQAKVVERIGAITEIVHYGGEDYFFKGENGNVGIRVILAGGWNIQRLHTRWVFDRKATKKATK